MLLQHENCNGCEALCYCYFVKCGCLLKYNNKKTNGEYVSLEKCPKPLTNEEFKVIKTKNNEVKKVK